MSRSFFSGCLREAVNAAAAYKNLRSSPVARIRGIATVASYGNAILLEPALRKLRRTFPQAETVLVGPEPYHELFGSSNLVDEVLIGQPYSEDLNSWIKRWKEEGVDTIAEFYIMGVSNRKKLKLLLNFPRFWITDSSRCNSRFTGKHEVDENLSGLVRYAGVVITAEDRWPRLELSGAEAEVGRKLMAPALASSRPAVGLHAGSNAEQPWKRWPIDHFIAFCQKLCDGWGAYIVLFGGAEERRLNGAIRREVAGDVLDLTGRARFRDTAAAISQCDLFVAGDSGLMNAANAVGVPLIALFGPTQIRKTKPLGPPGRALTISLNRSCQPCYLTARGGYPETCPRRRCLEELTPDVVWRRSEAFLREHLNCDETSAARKRAPVLSRRSH